MRTYLAVDREQFGVSHPVTFDRTGLSIVRLVLWRDAEDRVDIQLLRRTTWIDVQNVTVGGILCLNMPKMGVRGETEVLAIDAAPRLLSGAGCLVTGTFRHTSGEVYDLKLNAESKPIGVTATHPFWSCDRQAWVSAIDLRIGERLRTLTGTAIVAKISKRPDPEAVYNLEVEGDHVYRVGESGVLVHNASPTASYGPTKMIQFTNEQGQKEDALVGTSAEIILTPHNVGGKRQRLAEPGWFRKLRRVAGYDIHEGHILASQLGGKETGATNLTPLYSRPNTPAMNTCEGFLRKLIDDCKYCRVLVKITVNGYGDNVNAPTQAKPVMPKSITMFWKVLDDNDEPSGTFVIANDPTISTKDSCRAANLPCRQ